MKVMLKYGKPLAHAEHVSHIPTSSTIIIDTVHFTYPTTLKLSQLLRPLIDQSNAQFEFYDYALLDESGIDAAKRALPNLLRGKHKEMDAECKKAIDKLLSFF